MKFTIAKRLPKQRWMRVVYHREGSPDVSQSFSNLGDQSDPAILELIKSRYPAVLREWDAIEAAPEIIGELFWADAQGDAFMFDSTIESQNRIVAAIAAIDTGDRVDGGVWKCAQVDSVGEPTLVFRPMTNIELGAVGTLFNAHVQRCFETEAVCVAQVMAGNLDVDFQAEFEAL